MLRSFLYICQKYLRFQHKTPRERCQDSLWISMTSPSKKSVVEMLFSYGIASLLVNFYQLNKKATVLS